MWTLISFLTLSLPKAPPFKLEQAKCILEYIMTLLLHLNSCHQGFILTITWYCLKVQLWSERKVEVIKSINFTGTKHDNGCFIGVPADWNWTNVDTLSQATRSHINFSVIMYLILFNKMNCSWILIGSYFDKCLPRSSTLLFVLFIKKKVDSLLPFTCLCPTMIKFYPLNF